MEVLETGEMKYTEQKADEGNGQDTRKKMGKKRLPLDLLGTALL
jgi:hypothetical protein